MTLRSTAESGLPRNTMDDQPVTITTFSLWADRYVANNLPSNDPRSLLLTIWKQSSANQAHVQLPYSGSVQSHSHLKSLNTLHYVLIPVLMLRTHLPALLTSHPNGAFRSSPTTSSQRKSKSNQIFSELPACHFTVYSTDVKGEPLIKRHVLI